MDDSKLRAVRDAALEDAALIAEATTFEGTYCTTEDCSAAAVAIRALKDRPSPIPAADHQEMTDEQINEVWEAMPGGPDAWLRNFGYNQFARAVLAASQPPPAAEQDIDLEAIAWAYQKLLAYGVGNTNMDNAMMMDRLNLMLLGDVA